MSLSPEAESAIRELRKACNCLYLELHASIVADVSAKAEAVIAELEMATGKSLTHNEPEGNPLHQLPVWNARPDMTVELQGTDTLPEFRHVQPHTPS